jgi:hypothetical protein
MQDERRIDLRTLVIASLASAAAAVVTSRFWIRGTPIAAALTPVIVALVSELLHRPTEKIAQRLTTETDALPEAAGADPPPPSEELAPRPAPDPEFRVYRSAARKRRIAWKAALATGLLAFAIAAAALTLPELVAGGAIGGDRKTTLLGGDRRGSNGDEPPVTVEQTVTETVPAEPEPEPEPEPAPEPDQPPRTTPTTPTTPQPTTTTPAPSTTTP